MILVNRLLFSQLDGSKRVIMSQANGSEWIVYLKTAKLLTNIFHQLFIHCGPLGRIAVVGRDFFQ
jgi:hypothetical protein